MTQWGLDNLFNPGKRHMDDEKRRLQSTREEVGDASGGRRIDLESGTVSISRGSATDTSSAWGEDALEPALEAEEVPAVALAGDDAEIEPEVVDDSDSELALPDGAEIQDSGGEAGDTPRVEASPEPDEERPASASASERAAARRRTSASAWARRG